MYTVYIWNGRQTWQGLKKEDMVLRKEHSVEKEAIEALDSETKFLISLYIVLTYPTP